MKIKILLCLQCLISIVVLSQDTDLLNECPEMVVLDWMRSEVESDSKWRNKVFWSGEISSDTTWFPHACHRAYLEEVSEFNCEMTPFGDTPTVYYGRRCSEKQLKRTRFGKRLCTESKLKINQPVHAGPFIYIQAAIVSKYTAHSYFFLFDEQIRLVSVASSWVNW